MEAFIRLVLAGPGTGKTFTPPADGLFYRRKRPPIVSFFFTSMDGAVISFFLTPRRRNTGIVQTILNLRQSIKK
jgi:hypothetical protein